MRSLLSAFRRAVGTEPIYLSLQRDSIDKFTTEARELIFRQTLLQQLRCLQLHRHSSALPARSRAPCGWLKIASRSSSTTNFSGVLQRRRILDSCADVYGILVVACRWSPKRHTIVFGRAWRCQLRYPQLQGRAWAFLKGNGLSSRHANMFRQTWLHQLRCLKLHRSCSVWLVADCI